MLTFVDTLEALTRIRPAMKDFFLTEAAIDSRQVIPGGLFVAFRGERVDGHNFVGQAFKKGALAALIEHEIEGNYTTLDVRNGLPAVDFNALQPPVCLLVPNTLTALQQLAAYWRRRLNLRVIGITGSVGKSTTKEAIAQVLSQRYKTLKSLANLNNEIGLPLNVLRLTPGHQAAVLEMGFYVLGEIAQLCEIALPQVGVLTNIGTVHAERAGSQEIIAQGKGELVEALPPAPEGVAVLNYDDPYVRRMRERTRARVFYYGMSPEADLWADEVQGLGLEGIRFRLHYKKESLYLRVPMIGRHSVETALRAAAVGLVEHLTWDEIIRGLQESQTQLRLSAVRARNGALVIDDTYNAAPESTLAALNLLEEMSGRKVAVLGDMLELGQYEREGHQKVGMRAAQVADVLVTLGPRARIIAEAARKAGMKKSAILEYDDIQAVIEWLKQNLTAEDAVLVKGSHGLRMDRIVAALEAS
ncbi:MAG: UDP-N-acetylmuramoyl-tripeptide--D-alanyl-D-alanine ligase [Anaerolineales bacterium]|nr:UDP-N-acetylmuramoyl-tripeptide--D-alanyl-D-alanine ligase [Anaerolineales bacterium]MCX7754966.1 UDP-N-acetylmuramoyl-tripeptide--D-alanyl-D-alanine ligase [Anaerolineales bacterium]MDW8277344.1 UDP-N-acetylmuramoyl-tripeptide--D-alanyl-D-alanine ligase [Anaerolineales bacterium]